MFEPNCMHKIQNMLFKLYDLLFVMIIQNRNMDNIRTIEVSKRIKWKKKKKKMI